ncbi:MAG: hypothetical protein Q8P86_02715 [bacterium]|nr:hypothetical protein [bacterium]
MVPSTPFPNGEYIPKEPPERTKNNDRILKPLRTYEGDVAEALKSKKGSIGKIVIAEDKRRNEKEGYSLTAPEKPERRTGLVVVALFLIILGAGAWGGVYFWNKKNSPLENNFSFSPLFSADTQKEVDITGKKGSDVSAYLNASVESPLSLTSVVGMYFVQNDGLEKTVVSGGDFILILETDAPAALLRTLTGPAMFGIHSLIENQPFFITRVDNFENAFAGMLSWEKNLTHDLGPILSPAIKKMTAGATTTRPTYYGEFQDFIIKNKDVRALKDQSGNILLLYSFPDRSTLVITSNPDTFEEILRRQLTIKMVR